MRPSGSASTPLRARPGGAPLLLLACMLAPGALPGAEAPWLRRARPTGHLDFGADQAVAAGVARRSPEDGRDLALEAARTALRALLFPHPVDAESTLGDLAAYHPDLTSAIELQLARARVTARRAIPPDLEEVTLKLPLTELRVALLPFLLEPAPATGADASATGDRGEVRRVLLQLPLGGAARHTPPLVPSIRSLGGESVFASDGAWFRRFSAGEAVTYIPGTLSPGSGDLLVGVASVGGLQGATLFLRDDDAERVRRILSAPETPGLVVMPSPLETAPPPGGSGAGPPAPPLGRGRPADAGPDRDAGETPASPPESAPRDLDGGHRRRVLEALARHRARSGTGDEAPEEPTDDDRHRRLGEALAALRRRLDAGPPTPGSGPSPLTAPEAAVIPAPPTPRREASRPPLPPSADSVPAELAPLPPPSPVVEGELPTTGDWTPFEVSAQKDRAAARAAQQDPARAREGELPDAGEREDDGPTDLVEPPAIRWQYFREGGTEEGEVPR